VCGLNFCNILTNKLKTDKTVAQTSHYSPPTTSHHTEQQVQLHNQRNLVEPLFHLIVCCFLLISKLNSPSSWLIFLLSSTSSSFVYSSRMILLNALKLKSKNYLQSQTQQDQLLEEFGKISSPNISGSDKHLSSVFDRVPFSTDFLPFSCKNQNLI